MSNASRPFRSPRLIAAASLAVAACGAMARTTSHATALQACPTVKNEITDLDMLADEQPPCGAVRDDTRHGRLDCRVECESGRFYRVQVGADGGVTVKAYEPPR